MLWHSECEPQGLNLFSPFLLRGWWTGLGAAGLAQGNGEVPMPGRASRGCSSVPIGALGKYAGTHTNEIKLTNTGRVLPAVTEREQRSQEGR